MKGQFGLLLWFVSVTSGNLCFDFNLTISSMGFQPTSALSIEWLISEHLADCASTCGITWNCASFFYHQTTGNCSLHVGKMSQSNLDVGAGWTGYNIPGRPVLEACPGFLGYMTDMGSRTCFKMHPERAVWAMAREVCQAEGGDLISLNTQAKKYLLEDFDDDGEFEDDKYFLGAANDGQWRWIRDNSLIPWFDDGDIQDCLLLEIGRGDKYDRDDCDDDHRFICEIYVFE